MRKKFKTLSGIVALLLVLTMVAACAQDAVQPPAETGATAQNQAGDAQEGPARDSITIGMPSDISNLDPVMTASAADIRLFYLIFSRLMSESTEGFVPSVAMRYEVSDDAMTYTFFLRDDVRFHNGDLLTAHDVVFTFERAMESPFVGASIHAIESITAVDDHQVRFDLEFPFAPFLGSIMNIWLVSESIINEMGDDFSRAPIGSGPYRFVEHQPGRSVSFTRFDDYFGGPAPIRDVTYMVILSPATASIAVEAGDIDFTITVPPGDIERLAAQPNLGVTRFDTNNVNFLTLNTHMEPFNNPLVREAIARSIDRPGVIAMVAEGMGSVANSFLNDMSFGYAPDVMPFERDLDLARELLAQAGYPDGFNTTIQTIGGAFENLAQVIQSNLGDIGITATIELVDQAVLLGNLFSANYEIAALAVGLPGADASAWSEMFATDGGLNMTGYSDPEIDAWFELGRMTVDPAQRLAIYRDVAQRVNDTAAFIPIYFTSMAYVHHRDIEMGFIGPTAAFRVDELRWVR
ncbi:MAG: ABC transporter substrate-binding protein [Oscillospiraceae bacterium]|nr:ABC transporter substrate-binding protein [Oscillospiraceae bacterium]